MTNDEIKAVIASVRQPTGRAAEKSDISVAMRQAMIAKIIDQLTEIESGLE